MNSLLHAVNPVILKLKVAIVLYMVQFQMFQKRMLILVLFPMLLQMEILKIVSALIFELLEQRAVVADIELQQMAGDIKWSNKEQWWLTLNCSKWQMI
jgi:hypothetical protein